MSLVFYCFGTQSTTFGYLQLICMYGVTQTWSTCRQVEWRRWPCTGVHCKARFICRLGLPFYIQSFTWL